MSGKAGFGLRRLMISKDGHHRRFLKDGERKGATTDRTILVPGTKKEVKWLRRIFALAAKGMLPTQIIDLLNKQKLKGPRGHAWDKSTLYRILHNEKYIGWNVWGKTRKPLNGSVTKTPRESWVVKTDAFAPLITLEDFARVQKWLTRRNRTLGIPGQVLLKRLRKVLGKHGELNDKLLKARACANRSTYRKRFGSLLKAYELIGYRASTRAVLSCTQQKKIRMLRGELFGELKRLFPERLRIIQAAGQKRETLEIDGEFSVALHIVCPLTPLVNGQQRWLLRAHPLESNLPALICRVDRKLESFLDFYLTPPGFGQGIKQYLVLGKDKRWRDISRKLNNLADLCDLVRATGTSQPFCMKRVGDVIVSQHTSTVTVAGKEVRLGAFTSALFNRLVMNANNVVSRKELAQLLPGKGINNLNNHICVLRKRLGHNASRIVRVPNVGYKYCERGVTECG